jgi:predicted P-loop ATPase
VLTNDRQINICAAGTRKATHWPSCSLDSIYVFLYGDKPFLDADGMLSMWINEIGELSGFNRSETNAVKQFLSRTEDIYREPFGKRTKAYPRRCVFFWNY